jgi:nucleotide-binding universal stress UspA family protein
MTKEFEKILVGLDLSTFTADTLRCAARLSSNLGAELIVINVIHQRDVDAIKFIQGTTEMIDAAQMLDQQREERRAQAQKLLDEAGVPGRILIKIGVPWEAILDAVKETGAQMLVVGTKGRGDQGRTIFGSNAEKLFRHCPVTVVSARGLRHRETIAKLRNNGD